MINHIDSSEFVLPDHYSCIAEYAETFFEDYLGKEIYEIKPDWLEGFRHLGGKYSGMPEGFELISEAGLEYLEALDLLPQFPVHNGLILDLSGQLLMPLKIESILFPDNSILQINNSVTFVTKLTDEGFGTLKRLCDAALSQSSMEEN